MNLQKAAAKILGALLDFGFYDRGKTSFSVPAIILPKVGQFDENGDQKWRIVIDARPANSITKDVSFAVAHCGDTMAALGEIGAEQHRQMWAEQAGLRTSMEQDRAEMPLQDNEPPKTAYTSSFDIAKAFHRCPLAVGMSRDLSSIN